MGRAEWFAVNYLACIANPKQILGEGSFFTLDLYQLDGFAKVFEGNGR